MTLQQLQYIVAVDKYQQFLLAAEACGVTQPTLSSMVQKLETELDIEIFDRSKHPVKPTKIGSKVIEQAEYVLKEVRKLKEIVNTETDSLSGPLKIGIIPTLATYLVPQIIQDFHSNYPSIELNISEKTTDACIEALQKGKIDMFIAATPLEIENFYEIPIYYERFVAYFSDNHPLKDIPVSADNMPDENLWVLEEGHCFRDQLFNFCTQSIPLNQVFEAGSIETLVKIVDLNDGYSVIPEMHLPFLNSKQRLNTREIDSPPAIREISIVIEKNFVKERMVNAVASSVKKIIPSHMLNERLKKFAIKLR